MVIGWNASSPHPTTGRGWQRGKRVSFGTNQAEVVFFRIQGKSATWLFRARDCKVLLVAAVGVKNAIQLADVSEGGIGLDVI